MTASLDHTARIWNVSTGKTVRVLEGHAGSVTDVEFSADGRWVVTAGPRTGGVWSATAPDLPNSTDRLFFISDGHQRLAAATFAPSGWLLASAAAQRLDRDVHMRALRRARRSSCASRRSASRSSARRSSGDPVQGDHRFRRPRATTSVTVTSSSETDESTGGNGNAGVVHTNGAADRGFRDRARRPRSRSSRSCWQWAARRWREP